AVWDVDDQHLFGDDLVVAPVLEPGATVRRLYAPAGAAWEDPWTGAVHAGGTWIDLPAPRDRVPVLARRGSPVAALIRG
ncbi:MAG: putative family 31 glucosidase, partial [Planctomycetota bacterium]